MYTLLVLILSTAIFCYMKWRRSRASLYKVAAKLNGPPLHPIIGNALVFAGDKKEVLNKMVKLHIDYPESPLRLWFGHRLLLVFTDADQLEKILVSSKLAHKDTIYDPIKVMVGEGLITGSGNRTRQHRKLMAPILSPRNLIGYNEIFEKHTQMYLDKLSEHVNGPEFDIYPGVSRLCSDIVFDSVMDHQIPEDYNVKFLKMVEFLYEAVFDRLVKIWMKFDFIFKWTKNAPRYYKYIDEYIGYFQKLINIKQDQLKTKGHSMEDPNQSPSTLEQLLKLAKDEPGQFNDREILDEVLTLYAAAQDTATSICSFVFIMLGAYPEIQDKVYEETKRIRCSHGTPMSTIDIANLKYTEMVIKEVLRLFPIAPYLVRTCHEDVKIDEKVTIPADCSVVLGIYDLHHQAKHWEHPWDFYPDHFLPEAIAKRHPIAYLPFSHGVRACIGKSYAMMLMKVIVTGVVQRYKIVANRKVKDLHLHNDISVRSTYGYKVKLMLRS